MSRLSPQIFLLLLLCSTCFAFSSFGGDSASGCPMLSLASSVSTRVSSMFTTTAVSAADQAFDGTGNNVANPTWGSVNKPFIRKTPVRYADGVSKVGGAALPSPRLISNLVFQGPADGIINNRDWTAMTYAWGQFIDHDMTFTATAAPVDTMTFAVPLGDDVFDKNSTGSKTMSASRSNFDQATGTSTANPRQQVNSLTSFIDGSQVYGETATLASSLREKRGGRMLDGGINMLPRLTNTSDLFLTGDIRGNENPELCSLQILFVREHNRVAAQIAAANPSFSDEELYQRARRYVISLLQKVTYSEFLPAVLGSAKLSPYSGYRSTVNPSISNEFATAAFRLGHSMLGSDLQFLDDNGNVVFPEMSLRDAFFNAGVLRQTGLEPVLKYLASDRGQEIDAKLVDDVRSFLFTNTGDGGHDLAALNIQRSRDHGLASYAEARVAFGLSPVTAFSQITSDLAVQNALKAAYGTVDRVELWVGGLAEQHLPGSSVGPLFAAILKDQFSRLRDGDRFWYQNPGVLPQAQASEIESTLMSHIIKRNTKLVNLQPQVFFFETSVSGVACKDVNGDGMLAAPAPAPGKQAPAPGKQAPAPGKQAPAPGKQAPAPAPATEPLLKGIPVSLIAADGTVAASGVTDATGNFVLRAQLDLGNYTLKSSLNPSVAIRVTLTKGGCVSGFTVPINPTQVSSAEEVSDADAEVPLIDGPSSGSSSDDSFFSSQTNRVLVGSCVAACVVAGVVLGVVLKRRAARRGLLSQQNESALNVPLEVVTAAV